MTSAQLRGQGPDVHRYQREEVSLYVRTFSLLGERDKGEGGAISRPLGALPISAVGEAGERIFGEDGAVITAALTGFERLCERLWERACVGVVLW